MPQPIRVPEGLHFPALRYDPDDDTLEFDAATLWPLIEVNPTLPWNEDTLLLLLAAWYLHACEHGMPVDPLVDRLLNGPPLDGDVRLH